MQTVSLSDHHIAAIRGAAERVAEAAAEHSRAWEALVDADAACDRVRSRLDEKTAARDGLIQRRRLGDVRDDDAGHVLLIKADREALVAMLAEAEAAMNVLRGPRQNAAHALEVARLALRTAEAAAEEDAVARFASALDEALLDTIGRLDTLRAGKSGRPAWGASTALRNALRRLSAQRGEL